MTFFTFADKDSCSWWKTKAPQKALTFRVYFAYYNKIQLSNLCLSDRKSCRGHRSHPVVWYLYIRSTWCGSVCSGPGAPRPCRVSHSSDRRWALLLLLLPASSAAPEGCEPLAAETLCDRQRDSGQTYRTIDCPHVITQWWDRFDLNEGPANPSKQLLS